MREGEGVSLPLARGEGEGRGGEGEVDREGGSGESELRELPKGVGERVGVGVKKRGVGVGVKVKGGESVGKPPLPEVVAVGVAWEGKENEGVKVVERRVEMDGGEESVGMPVTVGKKGVGVGSRGVDVGGKGELDAHVVVERVPASPPP